ncbi:MAG: CPBP family intramembrane metalloprotease [archaeon]|nr:CPBP family intramembrane metalloprotease [archaeon]
MSLIKDQINYSKFSKIFALAYIVLVLLLIGLMVLSFPLGLYIVFNTDLGRNANIIVKELFIVLWFIYLFLFIKAIRGPLLPLNRVPRSSLNYGLKSIFNNTLSTLAVTFSALLLITALITILQESAGIGTGSLPEIDPILMFVSDSIAPIEEEIIFRVAIIGTVAILLLFIRRAHFNPLKVLWHPAKYISELGKKADVKVIYFFILISGALFGYAHIAFGAGWEIGKVTTSSLAGIILGLIYFFYGFPGAVLLHWSFNYFLDSLYYFEIAVRESSLSYFTDIVIIIVGLSSILFLLIYAIQKIKTHKLGGETKIYR